MSIIIISLHIPLYLFSVLQNIKYEACGIHIQCIIIIATVSTICPIYISVINNEKKQRNKVL